MFSMKTKKMWTAALITLMIFAVMSSFLIVGAEEISDNDIAVSYLSENGEFNPEAENADTYKEAATIFIDNYSEIKTHEKATKVPTPVAFTFSYYFFIVVF